MSAPLRVFVGVDERQPVAYTVCRSSIERHAKKRVCVEPIRMDWIPGMTRKGLTQFTFARYMVPWLVGYAGPAIFMDADIIVRADVHGLLAASEQDRAVSVAKHVARFEWPSVMVFQAHLCRALTLEYVNDPSTRPMTLEWAEKAGGIGDLPPEWNHCVGYEEPRDDAKLLHFTAGIPCWPETAGSPHAEKWHEEARHALTTVSWEALMGNSVHAKMVQSGALRKVA